MPRLFLLALEFFFLFLVVPLLIFYRVIPHLPIPYLLVAAATAFLILRYDRSFDSAQLISWSGFRQQLPPVLLRDAVFLALLGLAVRFFAPELLFSFVKRAPRFWAVIMLLYPLLSVYPQELLYRAFFFPPLPTLVRFRLEHAPGQRVRVRICAHYLWQFASRGALHHRWTPFLLYLPALRLTPAHLPRSRSVRQLHLHHWPRSVFLSRLPRLTPCACRISLPQPASGK